MATWFHDDNLADDCAGVLAAAAGAKLGSAMELKVSREGLERALRQQRFGDGRIGVQ